MVQSVLAMLCLTLAGPALASGVLYECDIPKKRDGLFWISDKIGIVIMSAGEVAVSEQVTLLFNKAPVKAPVTRYNDRRMVIRWTVKDAACGDNQRIDGFDYSAVLIKATNNILVHADPVGFRKIFNDIARQSTRNG
jgi:hypothetical protein